MEIDSTQLRRLRLTRSLSQRELAHKAGITPETVNEVEQGRRLVVRPRTLRLLAGALEVNPETLIMGWNRQEEVKVDSIQSVVDKTGELASELRGSGWQISASQRAHDFCIKIHRGQDGPDGSGEVSFEFCGNNFDAAATKLRRHLATEP